MTDYRTGKLEGLALALDIISNVTSNLGDGLMEAMDFYDECKIAILAQAKSVKGSVVQTVTQHPAKVPAPRGVVGSNPTATAIKVAGKNFVFTGRLARMTRADAYSRTHRAGGKTQTSVNFRTDYLVCAHARGTVKWNAAVATGTVVISEADWYEATK